LSRAEMLSLLVREHSNLKENGLWNVPPNLAVRRYDENFTATKGTPHLLV